MSDETCVFYSAAQALRTGGRDVVRDALLAARGRTLALVRSYEQSLAAGGLHVEYAATLNPPLWEWGHLAWFQEYWIARNPQRALGVRCDPLHERTSSPWNGADATFDSSRIAHRARWELALAPDAVHAYMASTLARTLALLAELPEDAPDDALYFFRLCALHEEMHAEAGLYMARALSIDVSAVPCRQAEPLRGASPLPVAAQVHRMGWEGPGFAFDNELAAHDVALDGYEIDAQPVTWGRFLEFVRDGGYEERRWWDDEGWSWLQGAKPPARDWQACDSRSAAVHLNAHEAQAWCRWAGRRLPTEAEWECAALTQPGFQWGSVWEWTASTFQPYPGFEPHPYRDYSAPWFGTRRVLRGACLGTAASLAHPRYRNFFEAHRSDVFAGFRSCADRPARLQV